eukprot:gene18294-22387_t
MSVFKKKKRWVFKKRTERIKDKSEGVLAMVSAYMCNEVGLLEASMEMIMPGKDKDGYWNNEKLLKQANKHLEEAETNPKLADGVDFTDVYDNSTGHN